MTYEEFLEFIPDKCMYETIYTDGDGHPILVIRLLDAYGMANKLASAEREACAKIVDEFCYGSTKILVEKAIRARGQA